MVPLLKVIMGLDTEYRTTFNKCWLPAVDVRLGRGLAGGGGRAEGGPGVCVSWGVQVTAVQWQALGAAAVGAPVQIRYALEEGAGQGLGKQDALQTLRGAYKKNDSVSSL